MSTSLTAPVRANAAIAVLAVIGVVAAIWGQPSNEVFAASILFAVFSVLSLPATAWLTRKDRTPAVISFVVGLALTGFAGFWLSAHEQDPEIFSPTLLGLPGGVLLLAGLVNLVFRGPHKT